MSEKRDILNFGANLALQADLLSATADLRQGSQAQSVTSARTVFTAQEQS